MTLRIVPVELPLNGSDKTAQLVYQNDGLVAVICQLSNHHGDLAGKWFLEADFSQSHVTAAPLFLDIEEAAEWLERRYTRLAEHPALQSQR
jgi:hypothetical protein